jgi:hypothetical protein
MAIARGLRLFERPIGHGGFFRPPRALECSLAGLMAMSLMSEDACSCQWPTSVVTATLEVLGLWAAEHFELTGDDVNVIPMMRRRRREGDGGENAQRRGGESQWSCGVDALMARGM